MISKELWFFLVEVGITTWVTAFSTITYLSVGQVAIYKASVSKDRSWLPTAMNTLTFLMFVMSLVGWAVAFSLYSYEDGKIFGDVTPELLALGFLLLPFFIWQHYGNSLLMALDSIHVYNKFKVIGSTLAITLLFLLLLGLDLRVEGALLAVLVGQIPFTWGSFRFLIKKSGSLQKPKPSEVLDYIQSGAKLHLNAIGVFLFSAVDILMLNYYRGQEETGYYQLGVQLMDTMMIVPSSASMVIYGKIAQLSPDKAWVEHKRILLQTVILMTIIALIAGFTAPIWLVFIAGSDFLPAVNVFRWQLLGVVGMTFSVLMGPQWIGRGYFWQASAVTLVVGLGNLAANSLLIPRYGMYGAIWASLGVYTISIVSNGIMILHCQKQSIRNLA